MKAHKGIKVAREILLIITFCVTIANVVLMIVEAALNVKENNRCVTFKDSDELPF